MCFGYARMYVCVCMHELLGCEAHARDEMCRQGTDGGHASSGGVSGRVAQRRAPPLPLATSSRRAHRFRLRRTPMPPPSPPSFTEGGPRRPLPSRSPPSPPPPLYHRARPAAAVAVASSAGNGRLMPPNAVSVAPSSPDLLLAAPPGGGCRTRRRYRDDVAGIQQK